MTGPERKLRNELRKARAAGREARSLLAEMPEPFPDWITDYLDARVREITALAAEVAEQLRSQP